MIRYTIALLPALLLLLLQQPTVSLFTFIVLGQGHFLLTYLYQFRAGKITRTYLLWYAIVSLLVFSAATYLPFSLMLVTAASIFAVHYIYDEARLLIGENLRLSLSLITPPMLFFMAYLLYQQYAIDLFPACVLLSLFLVLRSWYSYGARHLAAPYVLLTNVITAIMLGLYFTDTIVPSELLLGAIIIHHYGTWYVFQYVKLRSSPTRLGVYLTDVLAVNAILLFAFLIYLTSGGGTWLQYVFAESYFYAWTILHIVFASHDLLAALGQRARSYRYLLGS